jgi:hypothetical protein
MTIVSEKKVTDHLLLGIFVTEIPRNKNSDKSFSRSWSKNEPPYDKVVAGASAPFERGKYKSDGKDLVLNLQQMCTV